jgi:hypothetical protein
MESGRRACRFGRPWLLTNMSLMPFPMAAEPPRRTEASCRDVVYPKIVEAAPHQIGGHWTSRGWWRQLFLQTTSCHGSAVGDCRPGACAGGGGQLSAMNSPKTAPTYDKGRQEAPIPGCGSEEQAGSRGALPLPSMGALPFPLTTFVKEAAGRVVVTEPPQK